MSKQAINIQDGFLFQNLKAGSEMKVELLTGRELEGRLKRFDRFALLIETGGREILIYKHAVATIEALGSD
jgi:host factor-I protein